MAQFQYTAEQNTIKTQPVNFNRVQPNLGTSKAIDNLSNALLGATKLATQIKQDAKEEDFLTKKTQLHKDLIATKSEWEQSDYNQRQEILNGFNDKFVSPYDTKDNNKYNQQLMQIAMEAGSQFSTSFNKQTTAINDNNYLTSAMDALETEMQVSGVPTAETWGKIESEFLSKISNYSEKASAFKKELSSHAMYTIANNFKNVPEKNWDTYMTFKGQVEELAKLDPKIKGTDTYSKLLNTVSTAKNSINTKDITNLTNDLNNDNVPKSSFVASSKVLLDRGAISKQQHENNLFMKDLKLEQKNYKGQATAAYYADDDKTLENLQSQGQGAATKKVITDNLNLELSNSLLKNPNDLGLALDQTLKKFNKFQSKGIQVGTLSYVENVLNSPKTGGLQTEADIQTYLTVVEKAKANNYYSPSMKVNQADYIVLKTMNKLGLPDMVARYQSYKNSNIRVTQAQIDEVYNDAVDNDIFSRNLSSRSEAQMRSVLNPTIKALIKAGIDPDSLDEELDDAIIGTGGAFFEAGGAGFNTRVLIPKTGHIKSKDSYNNMVKAFNGATVMPTDPLNGENQWMVLPKDGSAPQLYPFKYMEYVSKTARQNKAELQKIKGGN